MSAAQELSLLMPGSEILAPVLPLSFSPRRAVEEHLDLVGSVLSRIGQRIPAHVDRADLQQAGVVGLLDAAAKYEPSTRVHFRAYAEIRIRGAILDALRGLDRVGRTIRRRINALRQAEQSLGQSLGRRPTHEELAEHLGMTLANLHALRTEAEAQQLSLEAPMQEGGSSIADRLADASATNPLDALCHYSATQEVRRALAALPEREQSVIVMSFFEEKTLKEIGEVLRVTESRACQLRNQGISRMQKFLAAQPA
jgi:RNA polymerase sigma factor for flagellar operon FliA